MTIKKITVLIDEKTEPAIIDYDESTPAIQLTLGSGREEKYTGKDTYVGYA